MVKLRLLPVFITATVSAAVLFGGWFIYDSLAIENPLVNVIKQTKGVQEVHLDMQQDALQIQLTLSPEANLRELHGTIRNEAASIVGNREIRFLIEDNASEQLEQWWATALFDVAEAMETKRYSQIPDTLMQHASAYSGLQVETEMDEHNVYVKLTDGTGSKFVVLPRTPASLGVWPNE